MTITDVVQFLGYLAGCWAIGYVAGFQLTAIKRFFETI